MLANEITSQMVDWSSYKDDVKKAIKNEELWGLGGSLSAYQNINDLEDELELIEQGEHEEVFNKYDKEMWLAYLI